MAFEGSPKTKQQILSFPKMDPDDPIQKDTYRRKDGSEIVIEDKFRSVETTKNNQKRDKFVDENNKRAKKTLRSSKLSDDCSKGLSELNNFIRVNCPKRNAGKWFVLMKFPKENHWKLMEMDSADDFKNARPFFDPNSESKTGKNSLELIRFSPDGQLCAIGVSEHDSDWIKVKIRRVTEGDYEQEELHRLKRWSDFKWKDNTTILYDAYETSDPVGTNVAKSTKRSLYEHKFGQLQSADTILAEFPSESEDEYVAISNEAGLVLISTRSIKEDNDVSRKMGIDDIMVDADDFCESKRDISTDEKAPTNDETSLFLLATDGDKCLKRVKLASGAKYKVVDFDGQTATLLTNRNAPMNKLVRVRIDKPTPEDETEANEKPLLVEGTDKVEWTIPVAFQKQKLLIICYSSHASHCLKVFLDDNDELEYLRDLPVDIFSSVSDFEYDGHSMFYYKVEGFLNPGTIYEVKMREEDEPPSSATSVASHDVEVLDSSIGTSQVTLEPVPTPAQPKTVGASSTKTHETEHLKPSTPEKVQVESVSVKPKEEPIEMVEKATTADSKLVISVRPIHRSVIEGFDPNDYTVEQRFYETDNCARKVPIFVVYRTEAAKKGPLPGLVRVYGGFKRAQNPMFNLTALFFCRHFDGVFGLACVRGGSEYGTEWHDDGRLDKKPNAVKDLINGGKFLIETGLVHKEKLSIWGGSNGGMVVMAAAIKEPTLFSSVISQVGVHDLLRYQHFTTGSQWDEDYGLSTNYDQFDTLYALSPLHNATIPASGLPALFFMTGDYDDRVPSLHTIKMDAELCHSANQNLGRQKNEILMRVYEKSGHGNSKPTDLMLEEATDMVCFLGITSSLEYRNV